MEPAGQAHGSWAFARIFVLERGFAARLLTGRAAQSPARSRYLGYRFGPRPTRRSQSTLRKPGLWGICEAIEFRPNVLVLPLMASCLRIFILISTSRSRVNEAIDQRSDKEGLPWQREP